jgi:hypothetical protein
MEEINMVDYMEAIKKPFSDMKTFVIGTILNAIPIVNLLVSGYVLKVAEDTINQNNQLRAFEGNDIMEYIIKYVMSVIISIGYFIIPLVVIGIGIGTGVMNMIAGMNSSNMTNALLGMIMSSGPIVIVGGILAMIAAFLMPMGLMKFLKSGDVKEAFNIKEVIGNALTGDYIITLIVLGIYGTVLGIIGTIIGIALAFIPVIGWLLTMIVAGGIGFAILVTGMTAIAQTVK